MDTVANLSKAGWSWGCVSALDSRGRTIWIADGHRDGNRFIVRADELLTAFVELQRAIHRFDFTEPLKFDLDSISFRLEYVRMNIKTHFRRLWARLRQKFTREPRQLELNLWSRRSKH